MQKINFYSCEFKIPNSNIFIFVSVIGSINKNTYHKFENFYQDLVKDKNKIVILSLTKIEYIDSTGLGILINFEKKCAESNVDLRLAAIPPKILHLFQMLGMISVFNIYESEMKALEALAQENKLEHSADYYLDKINQKLNTEKLEVDLPSIVKVDKQKVAKIDVEKVNISKSKSIIYSKIHMQYYAKMYLQNSYNINISIVSQAKIPETIITLNLEGCLITPSIVHLSQTKRAGSFHVTPVTVPKRNVAEIDFYHPKNPQKISFPLHIKKKITTVLYQIFWQACCFLLLYILAYQTIAKENNLFFFNITFFAILLMFVSTLVYYTFAEKKISQSSNIKQIFKIVLKD